MRGLIINKIICPQLNRACSSTMAYQSLLKITRWVLCVSSVLHSLKPKLRWLFSVPVPNMVAIGMKHVNQIMTLWSFYPSTRFSVLGTFYIPSCWHLFETTCHVKVISTFSMHIRSDQFIPPLQSIFHPSTIPTARGCHIRSAFSSSMGLNNSISCHNCHIR